MAAAERAPGLDPNRMPALSRENILDTPVGIRQISPIAALTDAEISMGNSKHSEKIM
jgi:hypothetical protein